MIQKLCSTYSSGDKSKKSKKIDSAIYDHLFEIGKQLLAEPDVDKILILAMDHAIKISGAERGLIILFNESDEILFETARNSNKTDIANPKFEISHTIIEKVRKDGESICLRNALENPLLRDSDSITRLKILSVICLPLVHQEKTFGVVYMDNRSNRGVFNSKVYHFIKIYTDFISLAAYNAFQRKQLSKSLNSLEAELRSKYNFESIVGKHPNMLEILQLVTQVADTDAMVLIQGESGTGKELIARALHFNSRRKNKAFVPINCGALPENLLESELFGHVRGAFTGAMHNKSGWFERANGGTIFLDEVSEMSPNLQVKLLRILQTGDYNYVGDTKILHCDVRIVAATNKELKNLVTEGIFREDLYYRLNVIDLIVPPLRERKSDIPLLIQHFLKEYGEKYQKNDLKIMGNAESILLAYDFPGNCRELQNIIQHAVVLCNGKYIHPHHLPIRIFPQKNIPSNSENHSSFKLAKNRVIEKFEQDYIIDCLKANSGNISCAAKTAGINVKNFYLKMKKYTIEPHSFKPANKK